MLSSFRQVGIKVRSCTDVKQLKKKNISCNFSSSFPFFLFSSRSTSASLRLDPTPRQRKQAQAIKTKGQKLSTAFIFRAFPEDNIVMRNYFSSQTGWETTTEKKDEPFVLNAKESGAIGIKKTKEDDGKEEEEEEEEEEGKIETEREHLYNDPRKQVLDESLYLVSQFGWSEDTLAAGARSCGYPSVSHGMFSRGSIELVEYFVHECNADLRQDLEDFKLGYYYKEEKQGQMEENELKYQDMNEKQRLKRGIQLRLLKLAPYLNTWPQALALGLQPQNIESALRMIIESCTDIAYFADYKSNNIKGKENLARQYDTDIEWYSYRAGIAVIYISTEIFMLTDYSHNFQDTWDFLDERLKEFIQLRKQEVNFATIMTTNPFYGSLTTILNPSSQQTSNGANANATANLSDSMYAMNKATQSVTSGVMSLVQPLLYEAVQSLPVKGQGIETLHTFVNDLTPPRGTPPFQHLQGKFQENVKNGFDHLPDLNKVSLPPPLSQAVKNLQQVVGNPPPFSFSSPAFNNMKNEKYSDKYANPISSYNERDGDANEVKSTSYSANKRDTDEQVTFTKPIENL